MSIFAIDKAKVALMRDSNQAFIVGVLLALDLIEDTDTTTAKTNGKEILFNPDFINSLSPPEVQGLLLHEAWHVALKHTFRIQERNAGVWNIACDHVVNLMVTGDGFTIPAGAYCDSTYAGMATEQVYDLLMQENPDKEHADPDIVPNDDPIEEQEQAHKEMVTRASVIAENVKKDSYGSLPPEMQRLLKELNKPKLDWRTILQNYMSKYVKQDFSWRKPNRRYLPDVYLPTRHSESAGEISVYLDVSGSITDDCFVKLITEAISIKDTLNPSKITFRGFNTELTEERVFTQDEPIQYFTFNGYGGTCITPVLEDIQKGDSEVSIIFTDGHFAEGQPVTKDVIWLIYNNADFDSKFGTIIHYED